MPGNGQWVAQRLMQFFSRISRSNWNQSPVEGLRPSEVRMLFWISKKVASDAPGIKVSEISKVLQVTPPTVTQVVTRLEAGGFVERSIDALDRRSVRIRLTDKGQKVVAEASEVFFSAFDGLADYLGPEDTDKLLELLSRVADYFTEANRISHDDLVSSRDGDR